MTITNLSQKGVAQLCWKALWAHSTLTAGYGLDGDSHAVTFFDLEVDPQQEIITTPGWSLGAMLTDISFFPWQSARGRFAAPFLGASVSCVLLVALVICQQNKVRFLHLNILVRKQTRVIPDGALPEKV